MILFSTRSGRNDQRLAIPLLIFAASALISTWAAYDLFLSWPVLLTLLVSVGFLFAIIYSGISPWLLAKGLVISGGLLGFYFIGQYAHFDYGMETGSLAQLGRSTGAYLPNFVFFIPHSNAVATFLEGLFLLSLVCIWRSRGPERAAWIFTGLIMAYSLLISGSRGAWLGLGIALGIWLLLLLPTSSLRLGLLAVTIIGAGLGVCILLNLAHSNPHDPIFGSILSASYDRFILYRNVFHLIRDYPFTGIGPGDTFAMIYSKYQLLIPVPFLFYAHNIFLAVGLGQGILGLFALIWLLISFYKFVFRVEWTGVEGESPALFRAAWLGVTATFGHGLIDATQFSNDYWTMPVLFALLGLAVAAGSPRPAYDQKSEPGPVKRSYSFWIPAVTGLVLVIAAIIYRQPLLSAWYANLGAVYQARADLSTTVDETGREFLLATALGYFEQSLQLNPDQPVANRRLGMIALEYQYFELAVSYLERAYQHEPGNQATLKALGYAYLWTGQLDLARTLLGQLDDRGELVEELGNWRNWWQSQEQSELSDYADQMIRLLLEAS